MKKIGKWALQNIGWIALAVAFIMAVISAIIGNVLSLVCISFIIALIGLTIVICKGKKFTLLKFLSGLIVLLAVYSWFIPASYYGSSELVDLGQYRVGLMHIIQYPLLSIKYFVDMLLYIILVGALYGVLGKTGKYRTLVEKLSNKIKGKEKLYLILVAFIFASLSSVFGYGILLFIFIPFIISVTLLIGLDKLTAFFITFGAILIGQLGSLYNPNIISYINNVTSGNYTTMIFVKLGLFVIALASLILFTLKHASKLLDKKKKDEKVEDVFLGEKRTVKRRMWHIIVIFSLLFIVLVLGCTSWTNVFNVNIFETFNTAVRGFTIKDFAIFDALFGEINAFGQWTYNEMSIVILISIIILTIVYKIKVSDTIEGIINGIHNVVKPILLIILAYVVLIITAYHPFFTTLAGWITDLTKNFNMFTTMLITILSSTFNIEMTYVAQGTMPYIAALFPSEAALNSLAIITQSFYGLTMFVAPTSVLLILGLTYTDIPYKEYFKKTWKFLVTLLVIVLIIILTASLII